MGLTEELKGVSRGELEAILNQNIKDYTRFMMKNTHTHPDTGDLRTRYPRSILVALIEAELETR